MPVEAHGFVFFFETENALILAYYTGPFTNRTLNKEDYKEVVQTPNHLP
jgi:hypothetical protein